MDALFVTRILCIVLWAAAAFALVPSFARYLQGSFDQCDELRSALFFAALIFVGGYISRVVIDEGEAATLVALNSLTAALAVFVLITWRQGRNN